MIPLDRLFHSNARFFTTLGVKPMSATPRLELSRSLPASPEVERAVLGAILLDPRKYFEASEHLSADHFSLDSNRKIFQQMRVIGESHREIDIISLTEELRNQQQFESVGVVDYIASLNSCVSNLYRILHTIS